MTTYTPGLHEIEHDEYLAADAASKSALDRINQSPAHYQAWKSAPHDPTDAMLFGTAAHRMILEPDKFAATCVVAPKVDKRTNAGKAEWAEFQAANADKLVLSQDQYESLQGMSASWMAHPLAKGVHSNARYEYSAFWEDSGTGLLCKARPDIIHPNGMILDLKTTENATEAEFAKSVARYRYHVQAAWYLDGLSQTAGQKFESFVFIAIEKKAPYAIAIYLADSEMVQLGRIGYEANLKLYAECMKSNIWPAYPSDVRTISLPAWAI